MSGGEIGWCIFLAGLPFAHLLNRSLDIWHGQAVWAQAWGLFLWAGTFWKAPILPRANCPLACFLGWIGLSSLYRWVTIIIVQQLYPLAMLQGLMHLLLIVFLYQVAITTWTPAFLSKLLTVMAWSGIIVLLYCGVQLLGWDQFFASIDDHRQHNTLVGTIGNPSHLATHLSLLLPLFLMKPGWGWKGMVLLSLVLLVLTCSIGGQIAAIGILLWWSWHRSRRSFWWVFAIGSLGIGWVGFHLSVLNPHGRWEAWQQFSTYFTKQAITGLGAGFVMELSRTVTDVTSPIYHWRHVHNEYFQAALEYGLIGAGFLSWMVWELMREVKQLSKTPMVLAFSSMLLAIGINGLVNFPLHLWLTGSYALVAYCGIRILATSGV